MFIVTDDLIINVDQITNARFVAEKPAAISDDYGADENGLIPSTLTIYFPTTANEGNYGCSSVELTGPAAEEAWQKLRLIHRDYVINHPSRKPIDYAARAAARRAVAVADDLPW